MAKGHQISPVEALTLFGCFRLAARIGELRNDGHNITTKICRDVNGRRYARYYLEETDAEETGLQEGVPRVPREAAAEKEPSKEECSAARGDS